MAELIARVSKTIDYLQSFKPEQLDGSEERTITIPTPRQTFTFPGLVYLRHWALPNFFFHVTTAYTLLRHNGVEIGKADYLGRVSCPGAPASFSLCFPRPALPAALLPPAHPGRGCNGATDSAAARLRARRA